MQEMAGKSVLITGANAGIGKATAMALAERGAHILLLVRNADKGEAARLEISTTTGNPNVEVVVADLAHLQSIRDVVPTIKARAPKLDVLINNAGVILSERQVTDDGFEATFQINHLGHFLLTTLLLDHLKASAPARIINLSSDAHHRWLGGGPLRWDDLQSTKGYASLPVYGRSKTANILFTVALAHRLAGTGVTANAVHPGPVNSHFGADGDTGWAFSSLFGLIRPFIRSPQKGAETSIYLATSPDVEEITGGYFANCRQKKAARYARDPRLAERLWDVSASMVGEAGQGTDDTRRTAP